MAAVPTIGRANRVHPVAAPEADLTRSLYEQYGNQIFRYCLHQLGSREEAEDAVQSTFLNAFRGIKRGIVPELESAWLFKIAHNVCLSRRRTTWRRDRIESPADFDLVEEMAPAPSRQADELIGLQDVLERMPETQRRAILLREWQGLSYREIAEEMELSQSAVETLIFRARRSLAQGLEEPVEQKRRRIRGADLANVLTGLKSLLLSGSVAVKVAAAVAVVSATTVVSTAPLTHKRTPAPKAPAAPAAPSHASAVIRSAPSIVTFVPPAAKKSQPVPKQIFASVHSALPTIASDPSSAAPPPADTTPAPVSPPVSPPAETPVSATPPGQAKKQDGGGDSSATAPSQPQNQAKGGDSGAQSSNGSPGATAPGQVKQQAGGGDSSAPSSSDNGNGNGNGNGDSSAPGQAKKQDGGGDSSAQSSSDNANGNANGNGNGNASAPGQAKKQDDAADAPAPTVPTAPPPATVTLPAPPTAATPAPVQQASGDAHANNGNGNGNASAGSGDGGQQGSGNGNGNGGGKGKGK